MPYTAVTVAAVLPAPVPSARTVCRALTVRRHIDLGRVFSAACR
ncbi:hypothetical protein ACFVT5_08680 [Streptomyces sp. NPDC058001]